MTWQLYPLMLVMLVQAQTDAARTATGERHAHGLGLEQRVTKQLSVTPIAIIEDSRCPVDVTCIKAGELIVQVRIEHVAEVMGRTVKLGASVLVPGGTLLFADAGERRTGGADEDYRFAFTHAPHTAF